MSKLEGARDRRHEHLDELIEKYRSARSDDYRSRVESWIEEERERISEIESKLRDVREKFAEAKERLRD